MAERLAVEIDLEGGDTEKFMVNGVDLNDWIDRGFSVSYVQDQTFVAKVTITLLVSDLSIREHTL